VHYLPHDTSARNSSIATIAAQNATAEHPTPIRAELSGGRRCSAIGITATGNAPVLALCRRLIEAGHNPAAPLEARRGSTLCLRVRSIGEGARLTVREGASNGRPRFVRLTGRTDDVGPPIAPTVGKLVRLLGSDEDALSAARRAHHRGLAPEEMATMDAVAALDEAGGQP
jgi:hypothetical protein